MASSKTAFMLGALAGVFVLGGGYFAYKKLNPRLEDTPTYQLRDDILVHGNTNLKEIALTFDDGPRPEHTRPLLDLLGKEGVRATFFVVGSKVEENPGLVRRMMNEGHEVANHTYSHPRLDGMSAEQIKEEIAKCGHAVLNASGAGMNLFRPPGMRYDDVVIRTAQDLGYVTIHWNAAAHDFQPQPPSEIVRKVLKNVQPGSVILLHTQPDTVAAMPEILRTLKAKGYRFVRVSQMLSRLPRPVYVTTNAFGVKKELVAKKVNSSHPTTKTPPPSKPEDYAPPAKSTKTSPPPKPGIDVPSWN